MKKINYYSLVALLLGVPSILVSCTGENNKTSIDDLFVPTFSNDKRVQVGAWAWTTRMITEQQLKDVKDADIDLLIGTFSNIETGYESLINRANKYDIDFIFDRRPWDGTIPTYVDNENFLGYCTYDEPSPANLPILKEMKENWDKSDLKNKMFFVNLNPCYSTNIGDSYDTYTKAYVEECGLEMVSFDYYALYTDQFSGEVDIREDWLYNFSVSAYYARIHNLPLWFTLLTTKHNAGGLNYINPSVTDLLYQINIGLSFGTSYMIHYTYAATQADHINPIVDSNGRPTDSYYDVKDSTALMRSWDSVYMNFDYLGTTGIYGSNFPSSGLLDYLVHDIDISDTGAITKISSDEDITVGHFEDKNNNKGFVITNLTNPYQQKSTKVTLELSSEYKGIKIYHQSEDPKKVEEIEILNKNNKIVLDIASGGALFVVPLKLNEK